MPLNINSWWSANASTLSSWRLNLNLLLKSLVCFDPGTSSTTKVLRNFFVCWRILRHWTPRSQRPWKSGKSMFETPRKVGNFLLYFGEKNFLKLFYFSWWTTKGECSTLNAIWSQINVLRAKYFFLFSFLFGRHLTSCFFFVLSWRWWARWSWCWGALWLPRWLCSLFLLLTFPFMALFLKCIRVELLIILPTGKRVGKSIFHNCDFLIRNCEFTDTEGSPSRFLCCGDPAQRTQRVWCWSCMTWTQKPLSGFPIFIG